LLLHAGEQARGNFGKQHSVTAEIGGFMKITESGVVLNFNDKLAVNVTL